ncbi:uncharacterized protein TRAVEDRAFT_127184, partial [Trametes versicolor FP-101664 SS1]|uniref:uncharacterized protein n=1 Tax=Trametes versicolor (strain FP-101664) TaxID=717944 RepID=UPI0004621EA2
FHMVSAVIRLGHKYQMQKMVTRAVDYLKRWFSDDFDAWSAGRLYEPGASLRCMHAIGVVNLARLVDEPSLLPTALLVCCTLDERIVEGFAREDGAQETLTLGDIGRCFRARARLAEHSLILAMRIFNPDVAYECEDRPLCERALRAMLLSVEDRSESFASPDVFPSWLDPMGEKGLLSECCRDCYEMLERRDRQERLEVWRELPGIMRVDVDGWAANMR